MALPKSTFTGIKTRKDNPISKEHLSGAAKRFTQTIKLGPVSGNFSNSTTYPGYGGITRAGKLVFGAGFDDGTNTITLRRGGAAGTALLAAGNTLSITAMAAGGFVDLPLTTVEADKVFDGSVPIYAAIAQGTPTTPGSNAALVLEFELDDFVAA